LLVAAREGAGVTDARLLVRRLAERGARRARALCRGDGRGRGDRRGGDLRSRRAVTLLRDPRGAARRAAAPMTSEQNTGSESLSSLIEDVYRRESRRVLATLIRLLGDFDRAEEALHDAFRA